MAKLFLQNSQCDIIVIKDDNVVNKISNLVKVLKEKSFRDQVPLTIRRVEGKDGEVILNQHSVTQVDNYTLHYFLSTSLP